MTIDWPAFTPWASLIGGVLIGLAAAVLILANGRVAGISGIVAGLLPSLPGRGGANGAAAGVAGSGPVSAAARPGERGWRLAFVAGLAAAPWLWLLAARWPATRIDAGWVELVIAGLLVGVGTRYGAGCTSGHGVCGLSRLSPRSLVATLVFMAAGFATVYCLRHLLAA